MARIALGIGILVVALAGCGHASDAGSKTVVAPQAKESRPDDPIETKREGVHQGAFQLKNAVDDLHAALIATRNLQNITKNANLKAALADVVDSLNDAGVSVGDFSLEPPDLDEFKTQIKEWDKKTTDAVNGANDALKDIDDVQGILDDFANDRPTNEADLLDKLYDTLDAATEDLTEAIKGFGGKIEEDNTEPVNPPVNPDDQPDSKTEPKADANGGGVKPDS